MLFIASIIIKEQTLQAEPEVDQPQAIKNKAEAVAVGGEVALVTPSIKYQKNKISTLGQKNNNKGDSVCLSPVGGERKI